MAGNLYVKSLIWLTALGGAGYGLMILTEPSPEKIAEIKASSQTHLTEAERKRLQFVQKLKGVAGTETPQADGKKKN